MVPHASVLMWFFLWGARPVTENMKTRALDQRPSVSFTGTGGGVLSFSSFRLGEGLQRKQKLVFMTRTPSACWSLKKTVHGGTMLLLLLLQSQLGLCVPLPAPSNVSISSYDMMHSLWVQPGPRTPPEVHFMVQTFSSRSSRWRSVAHCSDLRSGQTCNLTHAFLDVFDQYRARVRAVLSNQTSTWTLSRPFQPLSNTVLGPPDVSVSGCGNCLILQVRSSSADLLQHNSQLKDVLWDLVLNVHRTRDGSEFGLKLPYKSQSVIPYLQPGVEYCVFVSVSSSFNNNGVSSERRCSFTSPPPQEQSELALLGLLIVFSVAAFLFLLGRVLRTQVQPCSFYPLNFGSQTSSCLMETPLTQESLSRT